MGTPNVNITTVVSPASITISNNSLAYNFSGAGKISGPGSVTKHGIGTAILSTPNDYSGVTLVSAGTLALGSNDIIPDGAGKSDLTVSSGATFDLAGFTETINGLSGSGSLNSSGGAGMLRLGSNNVSSTFTGTIQNTGGTLALQKVGSGTLTLTGNNSYSGGTTISTGSILAGHNNALGVGTITLSSGNLQSDSTTARTLANNFIVTAASSLGNAVNNGVLTINGTVDFAAGARNLTCNNDVIINGFMNNGSLNKEGDSTLTTTGNADFITGAEVHRGTWIILNSVTNTDSTRPDANAAGIVARLIVTNGGAIILTGTAVNGRVGYTGGDATMTNILDLAGSFRMPNAVGTPDCEFTIGRNGSHGILNLYPNGDVQCRHLIRATTGTGNYAEVNFDGGIVRSATNDNNFISGLNLLTIRSRGATIDSDVYTIGTVVPFQDGGGGGLTKIGAGTFNMNATNTYTGATVVSAGTLGGNGTFASPVRVASGATLSPGVGIGPMTINNSLTLSNGSTTYIEVDASAPTNDVVLGLTSVTYGGTLSVSNLAGTLTAGQTYKIFYAGAYNGAFAGVTPATPGPGLAWDTTLLTNGTLGILASVNLSRTNIIVAVSGNTLDLSWPADHTGWSLQSQTNAYGAGLGTNWFIVLGSSGTNHVILPIDPANGSVFFRLRSP
jgi:autotransporter-associated beta strand protein